ncbi:hypothetical protein B0H14DRAFT_2747020 [Mycena olivaceomarginata]|nr:hypothetical protein B0H14DRAFT_2747020 [Mycena olivaceomarginata]
MAWRRSGDGRRRGCRRLAGDLGGHRGQCAGSREGRRKRRRGCEGRSRSRIIVRIYIGLGRNRPLIDKVCIVRGSGGTRGVSAAAIFGPGSEPRRFWRFPDSQRLPSRLGSRRVPVLRLTGVVVHGGSISSIELRSSSVRKARQGWAFENPNGEAPRRLHIMVGLGRHRAVFGLNRKHGRALSINSGLGGRKK